MNNDILLQISKLWGSKIDPKDFDRYNNYFSIRLLLLKGLYKYPLDICELFWDVKIKKQETQNGHDIYTITDFKIKISST